MSKQKNRPKFVEAVPVRDFYNSFKDPLNLELVAGEDGMDKTIRERSLNRPALAITGYFNYFAAKRIQLFGAGEMGYLRDLDEDCEVSVLTDVMKRKVPCILISRNLAP